MREKFEPKETQSPDEKFSAIQALTAKIEDNFIALGDILSQIKRSKLFRFKGYESFKDFIESEYSFSAPLAAKLIGIYELFIEEMDQDAEDLKEIGFDRLCSIRPLIAKADYKEREIWLKQAQELPVKDLKAAIKAHKESQKETEPQDLKAVLVDQWKERFLAVFNCSWTELQFKLALLFSGTTDEALLTLKAQIKEAQRQFTTEVKDA